MPKPRSRTGVIMTQIGARIRFLRRETGLSMRDLALKSNCSAAAIMQIELGRSAISGKLLQKIACGLEVPPFDLLNVDTQNDDFGYLVEKLRQYPEMFRIVMAGQRSVDKRKKLATAGAVCYRPTQKGFPCAQDSSFCWL